MKTMLLTGSNGFTGHYIRKVFEDAGYAVVGLCLHNPGEGEIVCDLMDKQHVRDIIREVQPSGVIHLAALSFVGHSDATAFYNVNIFGATNLLDALREEGIQPEKVIIASSANVYGNPDIDEVTEEYCPAPINHYAASKLAMENMVKTRFDDFPIIITRPFNYTGPGQDERFLVPKIVNHFRKQKPVIELGNTDVARNFSDVRDITRVYLELYRSDVHSDVINLSSDGTHELSEIISLMSNIAGYNIDIAFNPDFARQNEIKRLHGSNAKLKSLIGYEAQYQLTQTLTDMYNA